MGFNRFVEIGRVSYVAFDPYEGKLVVIVNVIDQNRALLDGPCTGVGRKSMNFRQMHLTKFVVKIPPGACTGTLKKPWEKEEMTKKWEETTWAKKIALRGLKSGLTDFDRFKLMMAKQSRNRLINIQLVSGSGMYNAEMMNVRRQPWEQRRNMSSTERPTSTYTAARDAQTIDYCDTVCCVA